MNQIKMENRPMQKHRLVFLIPVILGFLLSGLISLTSGVQARPIVLVATITPTIEPGLNLPTSGEPVILKPGNNARLVSPIKFQVMTRPGEDGFVRIELIGHDNRLIFRKLSDYGAYKGKTILIEEEIPFEVRADETARLQVILENEKGKPLHLTSVELTLLQVRGTETSGDSPINPRIIVEQPPAGMTLNSNSIQVKGGIKPINNTPLVFEILAKDWHTLTSRIIKINIPADQTAFSTFDVQLANVVEKETPVTLRIRQESNDLINGTVFLWSEDLILVPPY